MTLSTRLTMAMVGLVLFAIAVTGILTYRNLLDVAVPRSLERLGGHVELVAAELQAVVSAARADVLAFAVEQMVSGGSGEIADASNRFRRRRAAPADVAVYGGTDRQTLVRRMARRRR